MLFKYCLLLLLLHAQEAATSTPEHAYTVIRRYGWNESTFNKTTVRFGTAITLEAGRDYYTLSQYMSNAWELYFHWLNKFHGGIRLNGSLHPVELVLINDDSDKSKVKWATQRLVDNYGVKFLFGPYSSGLTIEAAKVANDTGATMLASGAASTAVFKDRPQCFGTSTPGNEWVAPAIEMFAQLPSPPKRIAFLQEDLNFPKFTCSSLASLTAQNNMTIVASVTVSKSAEYAEILDAVQNLSAASPDVVFSCNYNIVCKRLIQASRERDFNPKAFVLTTCVPGADFIEDLQRAGLHVMGTSAWSEVLPSTSALTNLTAREFYDMYYARYSEPPHYLSAAAFSAGASFVHAIESSNSLDPKTVADALRVMDVQTLYGRISFNDVGLCKNPMKVVAWQQLSSLTVVAPASVRLSQPAYPKPTWLELKCLDPISSLTIWGYDEQGVGCGVCPANTASSFNSSRQKRICSACPQGRSLLRTGDTATCVICRNGTFACGAGWQSPGYASYILAKNTEAFICNSSTQISQCLECPAGRYTDELGLTLCKECEPGKFQNIPGKPECNHCRSWDPRRYPDAFSAINASISCIPCPTGAVCELDGDGLRSGYSNANGHFLVGDIDYASELPLGKLYKCPHSKGDACLSNQRCYFDSSSDEVSMEGPFCGTCKEGFSKGEAAYVCRKCDSTFKSFTDAFSTQVLIFFVCSCSYVAQVTKHPRALLETNTIVFRQLMNYIHMSVAVFPNVELSDLGNGFIERLGVLQFMLAAKSPVKLARGAECLSQDIFPGLATFKAQVISGLIMVPGWLLFDLFFFHAVRALCSCRGWPLPSYNKLVLGITFNMYVLQTRLSQVFLAPFNCMYMDQIRLLADTNFVCDSDDVHLWQFVGALGLVFFCFGIPLTLAAVLHHHREQNTLNSLECTERYRFFFQGWKPEFYYFECIMMFRKVAFHMAAFIPWLSPGNEDISAQKALTSVSLLILCMLFLGLHWRCTPYDFREFCIFERIESSMLWAFLITCLMQVFIYMSNQAWVFSEATHKEENTKLRDDFCSAVVFVFHIRFLCWLLFGLFGSSIRRMEVYQKWISVGVKLEFVEDKTNGRNTGLHVGHLDDASRMYLADTFAALAGKQLGSEYFSYRAFNDLLRQAAVEAFYTKERERFEDSIPWLTRTIHRQVQALPDSLRNNLPQIFSVTEKVRPTYIQEGDAPWLMDPFYSFSSDSKAHFSEDHLQKAMQEKYSIEDIEMSVLQILWMQMAKVDVGKSLASRLAHSLSKAFKRTFSTVSQETDKEVTTMCGTSKTVAPTDHSGAPPRDRPAAVAGTEVARTESNLAAPDENDQAALVDFQACADPSINSMSTLPLEEPGDPIGQVEVAAAVAQQIKQMECEREALWRALRAKDAELLELEGPGEQADSEEEEWA
jgi:branched-chain amino acid transport system substrate-binding protein